MDQERLNTVLNLTLESFFDDLVDITASTNNRLLFDLNAEFRYRHS